MMRIGPSQFINAVRTELAFEGEIKLVALSIF